MIVNHVYIGRGPVKPSDIFNILTWVSIGATVNIFVANPDKNLDEEQHNFSSLFNVRVDVEGVISDFLAQYSITLGQKGGLADVVNLINLPSILKDHDNWVPKELNDLTVGWKNGIWKFLERMNVWWPEGEWNNEIMQRVFTVVDATKFYLAATKQGLTCDMKVAPTKYFLKYEDKISTQFISFGRGNSTFTRFENQLSGSMCEDNIPRVIYATCGANVGMGLGNESLERNARAFEKITSAHGLAMLKLEQKMLGFDSIKVSGCKEAVIDPVHGWSGPVRVFKHPKDQSWAGRILSEKERENAKKDIDYMADEVHKMMRLKQTPFNQRLLNGRILEMMAYLKNHPYFNIYAQKKE